MKKWLSGLAVIAFTGTLLAGCGSNASENVSSGEGGNSGKITLKLLQNKPEIADKLKQMLADYNKINPNVTIEPEVTADVPTRLKTMFASGDEPDIFTMKGYADMKNWQDKLADLSGEPWVEDVLPAAQPGMTIDGKKYGFPLAIEGYGFVYNKELFAKAGIDKVPTTLTELKEVNEKLKSAGITSYAEAYRENWPLGQHLLSLPFSYEPDPEGFAKKLNEGAAQVKDSPYMKGFFDVLDMTVNYGKGQDSLGISYDAEVASFASGKSAMMQQGVWVLQPVMKINPNIRMGMFAIPLTENPEETKLPVSVPNYYVVNKNSKHLDEVKKFLAWLHDNGQKYLVESFQFTPAFTSMKASADLGPLAEDMGKYVTENKTLPWAFALWPNGGIREQFVKPLQQYIAGQMTQEEALEDLQKSWTAAVE
ncbi:ABC transporter substrate-binding protein [Paenibacillus sabinae]|uniref:Family 1 extracellular solute-binding protein n=1 Tax=Paenibacillus sabinae T27 TaxID=1268072 RepID=X4ZHK2_9BACL|nr:extracellular solute-binding protein [Paenibacillus sabinae]AHV96205.1 family 1 extracellular solute-binding protein [Paenibacillus sabinae T27]